jgi:hypothetical protein
VTQGQRILAILNDGKRHSHHEFYGFCVLHSRISDLRKKGHSIVCFKTGGVYEYQLFGSVQEPGLVPAIGGADRDRPALGPSRHGPPEPSVSEADGDCAGPGLSPSKAPPGPAQLSIFEAAA